MKIILIILLAEIGVACAYSPEPGSPERRAIIDAIRASEGMKPAPPGPENPNGAQIRIKSLQIEGIWACASVTRTAKGEPPYWVILQNTGSWHLLNYMITLGPFLSEKEREEARGMSKTTVETILKKFPDFPASILPAR